MNRLLVLAVSLILGFTLFSAGMTSAVATTNTYVLAVGRVTSYGSTPAFGFMKTFAQIDASARVNLAWMTAPLPIVPAPGLVITPLAFSFLAARLINASIVKLNYTDTSSVTHDLYIEGVWNVLNVTFTYKDSTFNFVVQPTKTTASGVFTIDPSLVGNIPWSTFTLAIQGVSPVTGTVAFHRIANVNIPDGDVNQDGKIDVRDLATVAKSYGTTPGRSGYDFNLDLNFDFRVDIRDLAIVARSFGASY